MSNEALINIMRRLNAAEERIRKLEARESGPNLGEFTSSFLDLPGLRGLWFAGNTNESGTVIDVSGQSNSFTYAGNPILRNFSISAQPIFIPHYNLDGTGDYFYREDVAGISITGTETTIATDTRGLTMGGWFRMESIAGAPGIMSKHDATGNNRSYLLRLTSGTGTVEGRMSTDGTNDTTVLGSAITVSQWYFIVLRFEPSQELSVIVNNVRTANTSSIPASIYDGNAQLQLGAYNAGTNLATMRWCMSFLCASALSLEFLGYLYNRTRGFFGV